MTALDKLRTLIESYNPASSQRTAESVAAHHELALLAHHLLLPAFEALEMIIHYENGHRCESEGCSLCTAREVLAQLEEALSGN